MKVRIGIGLGAAPGAVDGLDELVAALGELGFDSIWLPEILTGPGPDPLTALSFLAGRHRDVKLGTTMLLPGRNLLRLAKQLVTLDRCSQGRLLVTFVPGLPTGREREAVGVAPPDRGRAIEDALPALRSLLAGNEVGSEGVLAHLAGARLELLSFQRPLEFWLGGTSRPALVRCGRLGDGWLPARCMPEEAAAGRLVIEEEAARCGREISPEHFGASIAYQRRPPAAADGAGRGAGHLVPVGLDALRDRIRAFVAVGFSKFVVRPLEPPRDWPEELAWLASGLADLQS